MTNLKTAIEALERGKRYTYKGRSVALDNEGLCLLASQGWYWNYGGYLLGMSNDRKTKILFHRVLMNTPAGMEVDHINGDSSDNRIANLRDCTRQQNCMNIRKRRKGLKGVYMGVERKSWRAAIMVMGKNIYLGHFKTEEEAHEAYKTKAKELFGEFANFN